MDITSASTEPFHRFHRFHEAFNRNMRISVGALGVITGMKSASQGTALKLPTLGEPWGAHTLWSDVTKEIPGTKRFLSQIGVISVFSALKICWLALSPKLTEIGVFLVMIPISYR